MRIRSMAEKTFFWYRAYIGFMALLYLAVAIGGIALLLIPIESGRNTGGEMMFVGGIYAFLGAMLFILFVVAMLLPPKPYNWIVGIILIAIGLTSCCLLPALIPLLIYWVKPETQAFFGRKMSE